MKRKFAIFNLVLMAMVQFAIAFQSFHAFTHTHNLRNEKQHTHKGTVVTADDDSQCHICDFHFDFFTAPQQFCLRFHNPFKATPFLIQNTLPANGFVGSLFALRAPPALA